MPSAALLTLLVVHLALATSAVACKDTSTPPVSGTSVPAALRTPDGGGGPELVIGERVIPLPDGEIANGTRPVVMQDASGARFAYVTSTGDARTLYVVAGDTYLGPKVNAPIDFKTIPELDRALGSIFENAGARRAKLVDDVAKQRADAGLARMLIDGAHVDAPEWETTFAKLPEPRAAEVRTALASLLEKDKPTAGLRRAAAIVPLREPGRAPALAARLREVSDPIREPRALAAMLRALAVSDKTQAGTIACDVLGRSPLDTANVKGTPDQVDLPGREALVEAALVAIAASGKECPHVAKQMGDDVCLPYFRCGAAGPLTGREESKQDEPLCTKEQLAAAISKELERSSSDVIAITGGTRPQLFAFAALSAAGKAPPTIEATHARRRYAVVQPKEPPCEAVPLGKECHCDEATLRDQTCRHPESKTVQVGLCKFDVDDKSKKLTNVVATSPP